MKDRHLLAVHGGVTPAMRTLRDLDARVCRVRWLDKSGQSLPWPQHSDWFWADTYDGRFGFVVFGHESWPEPTIFPNALGLDGHSYGKIYAAIFTDERRGLRLSRTLTVPYKVERLREQIDWRQISWL
jgi:hypothetical protein